MAVCKAGASQFFGHIYIVYADNRFGDGDIFFRRSEDGGQTWPGTFERKVNDDEIGNGKDQFFPSISVDENCKINISFYDRRDDPDNLKFHLYFSHSSDDGEHFSPNARVTTAPSTNAQFLGGFIGDYLQNAATVATLSNFHHDLDRAVALWMDTREGGQDVYAATLLQTQGGTWINVDVNLVANQSATNLEFVFPGDVSAKFSDFYHGSANPFQSQNISYNVGTDQTTLSFVDPEPGPLSPGDTAHVGFVLTATPEIVNSFWTGSGNIGSVPMGTVDFTYDPVTRVATAILCNDRQDGMALSVSGPQYAVLDTPIELEQLNATDLPGALAAKGAALAALPPPAAPLSRGSCHSMPIPESVAQFKAVLLTATLAFSDRNEGSRLVLFAQKVAKDAREVCTLGVTDASADPSVLWPPNHKMVDVTIDYTVRACARETTCTLSVSSNEPVDNGGDGNTSPDWTVIDAIHVNLRAERAASGAGRIYTVTITCSDPLGQAEAMVEVSVPHHQGH
jgi:hypothetical protein